mmetsp:Transcript_28366/g.25081  ORF Transcript_28366/g.25081 Transcript_28366/m.25081 type:complete len:116 (+) Transcript_28366:648-995(+)
MIENSRFQIPYSYFVPKPCFLSTKSSPRELRRLSSKGCKRDSKSMNQQFQNMTFKMYGKINRNIPKLRGDKAMSDIQNIINENISVEQVDNEFSNKGNDYGDVRSMDEIHIDNQV